MNNLTDLSLEFDSNLAANFVISDTFKGIFFCDRSDWGLLQLTGEDRLRFLHNQSTNNINILKSGQGCTTVIVNSTGRTLDLVTVYVRENDILLIVSPERKEFLLQWFDRFIFPFDKVTLKDISDSYSLLSLMGNDSNKIIETLTPELSPPYLRGVRGDQFHTTINFQDSELLIAVSNDLKINGYNFILPLDKKPDLCYEIKKMWDGNLVCLDWEKIRILQGRPAVNKELTEDYNPLEAGLWDYISFNKGCYIGQETIARLNTYKGVKQRLWGLKLNGQVTVGETITINGEKAGILTSFTETEKGYFGLGYIKTKLGGEGSQMAIGNVTGEVIAVPFLKHEYYQPEKQ